MKTNIDNVLNDIQLHKFYENTFCALARYYNNVIDTIQICDTAFYDINSIEQFKKLCVQSLLENKIRHHNLSPFQRKRIISMDYVVNIICAGKFVNRDLTKTLFTLYDNHSIQHFYYSETSFYLCDI